MHPENLIRAASQKLPALWRKLPQVGLAVAALPLLWLLGLHAYPLFHDIAELFGAIIGCAIFMLIWNTRRNLDNGYLVLVGTAYLFVGGLELMHTLVNARAVQLAAADYDLALQLWIAARYLQSVSLVIAPLLTTRISGRHMAKVLAAYVTIFALLLGAILQWGVFPHSYLADSGITAWHEASNFVTALLFMVAAAALVLKREHFDQWVLRCLLATTLAMLGAGLSYIASNHDVANLMGHIFKLIATYLLYRAVIVTALVRPNELLFRNLEQAQQRYRRLFEDAPVMYVIVHAEAGTQLITDCNALFLTKVHASRQQVVGQPLLRFCALTTDGEACHTPITDVLAMLRTAGEGVLLSGNGGRLPVLVRAASESAPVEGIETRITLVDISDLKRAEQEIGSLARFPGENPNPVLRVARDGTVLYANAGSQPLLSHWHCQPGQSLPDDVVCHAISMALESGESQDHELLLGERTLQLMLAPIPGMNYVNIYGIDITRRKRSEEALQASEARFRSVLEHLGEGVGNVDLEECFVFANTAAERIFGVPPDSLVGRNLREFTDAQEWVRVREQTARRRKGEEGDYEMEIIRPDGRRCIISVVATPWIDEHGRLVGALGVFRDVTDQKRMETALRESETLFRTLAETSSALIMIYEDGQVHYVNPAAVATLGYAPDKLQGMDFRQLIHPDSLAVLFGRELMRQRGEAVPERIELKVVTKRGQERWLDLTAGQIIYNGRPASLATAFDISERKWAEAALAEERAHLAQRVEGQTAELRAANAELARAARLKDEFLANMSHELRTPLNAILGLSEALQEQVYGSLTERQLKSLAMIEESGRHLLALINDILDLSKIEAGKLELQFEPVDVAAVCQASLQFVKQTAFTKRIVLGLTLDSQVQTLQADQRRLKQILVNLMSNAVKFTPEGGRIGLEVAGDEAGGVAKFTVWDTGIGIAPDQLERIFQPFIQVDSSFTRQYEGTGLGLALARRLVDQHGGSITLESDPGHGSRFTVALPWQTATQERVEVRESGMVHAAQAAPFQSALIVEDMPSAAEQLVRYLAEWQIRATVHARATGIIERVLAERPDVIILDILLPDGSGWDVLTQLRADARTRSIPVLVVSVVDDAARGLGLGAVAYLVKPIVRAQLQAALSKLWPGEEALRASRALVVLPDQDGSPSTGSARPLILLAEDNETSIAVCSDYLQAKGYRMRVARDGLQAVALAHQEQPWLILMDIQMPGMDGLEAIRRIRGDSPSTRVPIIALTALAMSGDRERCLAAGADEYLTKPVNLQRLVSKIAQLLTKAQEPTGASDE